MASVKFDIKMEKKLTRLAKKTKSTKSFHVRKAVSDYLENIEDHDVAWDRLENPGKIWSLEDIKQGLDLL